MALLNVRIIWDSRPLIQTGTSDFMHLYVAGKMARSGLGKQLFDRTAQFAAQSQFSEFVRRTGSPYPYMRPPFEALLFVPFSYVSFLAAYVLWCLLAFAMLFSMGWLLRSQLSTLQEVPWFLWPLFLLAFFPVTVLLAQGQDDALLVLLLTLTFLSLQKQRDTAAGTWLGLAIFRPQFVAPLVCIFLCNRQWSVARGFLAAVACIVAVSIALFGWAEFLSYPAYVISVEGLISHRGLLGHTPNLHGFFSGFLLGRVPDSAIMMLTAISSAAVLIGAAELWRRSRTTSPALGYSAAIVATVAVSYHAFAHDLTVLLLPVLLQVNWWLQKNSHRKMTTALLLSPMAMLFLTPLCVLLVQSAHFNLFAIGLLLWLVGSAGAIEDHRLSKT